MLLQHNVDSEERYKGKQTPLHHAVSHYKYDGNMVKLLLEHKADIEARDKENQTPLQCVLLKNNVDIEARDKEN